MANTLEMSNYIVAKIRPVRVTRVARDLRVDFLKLAPRILFI